MQAGRLRDRVPVVLKDRQPQKRNWLLLRHHLPVILRPEQQHRQR